MYYPNGLAVRTWKAIWEAIEAFPYQDQVLELCRKVISDLTPSFSDEIRTGRLRTDRAPDVMKDLLRCILVNNDRDSDKAWQLGQELRRSKEWGNFMGELEKLERVAPQPSAPSQQAQVALKPVAKRQAETQETRTRETETAAGAENQEEPVEKMAAPALRRRVNAPQEDSTEYEHAAAVRGLISQVGSAFTNLKNAKCQFPTNQAKWKSAIRREGFSEADTELILQSKKVESAAQKIVAHRKGKDSHTIANSYSKFKDRLA